MEQKPKYLLNYPFWEQNKNKQLKNGEECHSWINKVQVYCFYRLGPTIQHCILGNGKPEASELGKEWGKKQNKTNSVFFPIPNYVFKISWNQNVLFPNSLHSSELCPTSLHLLALNSTGAAECRKCLGSETSFKGRGKVGETVFNWQRKAERPAVHRAAGVEEPVHCAVWACPRKSAREEQHVNPNHIPPSKANELRHTSYCLWIQEIGIQILHFVNSWTLEILGKSQKSLSASELMKGSERAQRVKALPPWQCKQAQWFEFSPWKPGKDGRENWFWLP